MAKRESGLLFVNLAERFKRRILAREMPPTSFFPSVRALEKETGLSRNTILAAIKLLADQGFIVKGDSRRHGYKVAEQLPTFQKDQNARQSMAAEMILPFESWNFVASNLLGALEDVFSKNETRLIFSSNKNSVEEEGRLLRRILDKHIMSIHILVFMTARSIQNPNTKLLHEIAKTIPVILLDRTVQGFPAHFVGADNRGIGYRATCHLLEQGHKQIGFISGFSYLSTGRDRFAGYAMALRDAGVAQDESIIFLSDAADSYEHVRAFGNDLAFQIQGNTNLPTAWVCGSDKVAIGIVSNFKKRNLKFPKQAAVVGCDNDKLIAHAEGTGLTSFEYSYQTMAEEVYHLLQRVTLNPNLPPRLIEVPAIFVPGETA